MKLGQLRRLIREEVEAVREAEKTNPKHSSNVPAPKTFDEFRAILADALTSAGVDRYDVFQLRDKGNMSGGGMVETAHSYWREIQSELQLNTENDVDDWAVLCGDIIYDCVIDIGHTLARSSSEPVSPETLAKKVCRSLGC
jgi:hypothetical protein